MDNFIRLQMFQYSFVNEWYRGSGVDKNLSLEIINKSSEKNKRGRRWLYNFLVGDNTIVRSLRSQKFGQADAWRPVC